MKVVFHDEVKAIAPGQSAVFYDGNDVIGGGWIENSFDVQFKFRNLFYTLPLYIRVNFYEKTILFFSISRINRLL